MPTTFIMVQCAISLIKCIAWFQVRSNRQFCLFEDDSGYLLGSYRRICQSRVIIKSIFGLTHLSQSIYVSESFVLAMVLAI